MDYIYCLFTESRLGDDALRTVARFARPGSIDRHDPEFVLVTFLDTVGHFSGRAISRDLGDVDPQSTFFVSHLYNVLLDRCTSVILGRSPLKIDKVLVPVLELRSTRLARFI